MERFIRHLREASARIITSGIEHNGHRAMLRAVENYNASKNSFTGEIPNESFTPEAKARIIAKFMNRDIRQLESSRQPKFHLGQVVRLKRHFLKQFEKAGTPLWQAQQYKITGIVRSHPVAGYQLSSLDGLIQLPSTVTESSLQ